jgi:hypothetical protein
LEYFTRDEKINIIKLLKIVNESEMSWLELKDFQFGWPRLVTFSVEIKNDIYTQKSEKKTGIFC